IDGTATTGAIRAAQPTEGGSSLAGEGKTGLNAWIQGFGADGSIGARSGTAKINDFAAGVAVGLELKSDTLTIGAAGSVSDLEANVRAFNSSNKGTLYQGGVYIAFDDGTNYANVSGSYFSGTINTARTVSVGANIVGKAVGQAGTNGYAGGASVGRRIGLGGNMYFTPQLGADLISVTRDAFIESGAGVLSLSVNREKRTMYSGLAEGRLSYRGISASGGVIEPYVSAGVRVNFGDLDTLSSMRFTGAPSGTGGFTIAGARMPKTSALVSAGINANPSDKVSIGVEVGGSFGDKQQEGRVGLHLKIGF
ncbi:MAG: autotransporter outer membrane beta-barrel domain-containing protein, partial [Pseudomonadota bacterium]